MNTRNAKVMESRYAAACSWGSSPSAAAFFVDSDSARADNGVWHSAAGGQTWAPMANGLPDAPVFDVQVHPTRRLLQATTHGRGLYQYKLADVPPYGDA
jgi:hypothetical protein